MPSVIVVGGHSAGGYLTFMIGLDPRYLRAHGLELSAIAGLIPVSGQTMTHYTVRKERGIGQFTITADEAAPVFHVRKDTPPMLVLYADNDMAARAEDSYLPTWPVSWATSVSSERRRATILASSSRALPWAVSASRIS